MNLFDQISEDIKQAMLAKDKVALDALRGIKKEFLEAKTAKGADGELPKYWSFSFSISPSKEIPGLISFRMGW